MTKAKSILKRIKPAAVFSKGGFVSVPVVLAAHSLKIPVILHESDYTPGLANRICIPRADKVCVAFSNRRSSTSRKERAFVQGCPSASEVLKGPTERQKGLEAFCGFSGEKPVLLIMGGSLGAKTLNDTLDDVMTELVQKYDVVHIRGKKNLLSGTLPEGYKQFGYVGEGLADIYAAADIMLSRAGATAVFEILALAMPALLVPLQKHLAEATRYLMPDISSSRGIRM